MSMRNYLINSNIKSCLTNYSPFLLLSRNGHTIRGKPPGVARSLEQRLKDDNPVDPEIEARINIGFPSLRPSRSLQLQERLAYLKVQRKNPDLEKNARSNELLIDLEQVRKDSRLTSGAYDAKVIADHYGIYKDLFGYAYFIPRVPIDIKYEENDVMHPVYNGNVIKPAEAQQEPIVSFDGTIDPITGKKQKDSSLWTLIATGPDGHLPGGDKELIHWFISNIPNGDVKNGNMIAPYLQPFPAKGLGYQRFIFILYKQNKELDFSEYKVERSNDVEKRSFSTLEFYRKYQEDITPAGLAFYQSDWDKTITQFYHDVLNIKEPIFEYDFPAPYLADQQWFPLRQPFNLYMDKHRDIKQINKEYLERKLAKTDPFDGPEAPLQFPNAHPIRNTPSWLRTEIRKNRLGIGRINDY